MAENEQAISNPQFAAPKALILTGFGINCEEEMAAAYRLAGAAPTIVHLNEVLHGRVSIHDFDILNFPGGFSFGDDLGSGVVLANKLRYRQTGADGRTLLSDIREFVAAGKFVLGICNGFQVLVKLGLLPNLGGDFQPELTLTHNASGRYENRWVRLRVNALATTPFLRGLTTLEVPVRHGEGRLVVPDAATREQLIARGLNCLTYADGDDVETGSYPLNPNGADLNCAGLTDTTGHIFGLMPHPEAYLAGYNHPDWGRRKRRGELKEEGEGLAIFRNIVAHLQASLPHPAAPASRSAAKLSERESQGGAYGLAGNEELLLAEESAAEYHRNEALPLYLTAAEKSRFKAPKQAGQQTRKQPTPAENQLWQALRNRQLDGLKFRCQHTIEQFIVGFICLESKLIVEVTGDVQLDAGQTAHDQERTQALENLGYQVIRFSNEEVLQQLPEVLIAIAKAAKSTAQAT
jgi:phosphoribosylformylglycinamidine synthase I